MMTRQVARVNRLQVSEKVRNYFPFHRLTDGALFAFQRGLITYSEYCVVCRIGDTAGGDL
jgi:hypothetical protein